MRINLATVCLLLLCTSLARAEPQSLAAAKNDYEHGDYLRALALLAESQKSPELTEDGVVQVHWLRGACFHALGKRGEATKAFDAVLKLQPLFQPNPYETPPDLRALFKKQADEFHRRFGVQLGQVELDEGANVRVTVTGAGKATSVMVFARSPGDTSYRKFELPVADAAAKGVLDDLQLWERVAAASAVELVVEARSANGVPIARSGDALKPLSVPVTAAQAQGAITLLKPPPMPNPEPLLPPPSSPEQGTDQAPSTPSPLRLPLLVAGAAGLVVAGAAGVGVVLAVVFGGASGALAGGIYYYAANVVGAGRNYSSLQTAYTVAVPLAGVLLAGAAALLLVGLAGAGAGGGALVARQTL